MLRLTYKKEDEDSVETYITLIDIDIKNDRIYYIEKSLNVVIDFLRSRNAFCDQYACGDGTIIDCNNGDYKLSQILANDLAVRIAYQYEFTFENILTNILYTAKIPLYVQEINIDATSPRYRGF